MLTFSPFRPLWNHDGDSGLGLSTRLSANRADVDRLASCLLAVRFLTANRPRAALAPQPKVEGGLAGSLRDVRERRLEARGMCGSVGGKHGGCERGSEVAAVGQDGELLPGVVHY
ncbi:hypothetical protein NtRootA4_06000 [Arthrobacter sp. NtRootA4]|nr:hypothetical protein NtRootA2_08230 [Arthrobacter sp. NtRootA2]BCW13621.1 hypothetical protein NtRootA4_06000 [Arthrobacter sp. NtRootA4]BCW21957.1 hypothetical protein NtRootC7_08240 [Arthrobacter sp. NtRootC7]BCW26225.1 hypothetical protein NtRootC45_08250 [Arthrobacter sp. NtRootC45]BCW30494.1 hypothetical protein NtRootD5_08250 [Arthrobacter sp. NtRootD5]